MHVGGLRMRSFHLFLTPASCFQYSDNKEQSTFYLPDKIQLQNLRIPEDKMAALRRRVGCHHAKFSWDIEFHFIFTRFQIIA